MMMKKNSNDDDVVFVDDDGDVFDDFIYLYRNSCLVAANDDFDHKYKTNKANKMMMTMLLAPIMMMMIRLI